MKWLVWGVLISVLFLAPLVGLMAQPFAPWWFGQRATVGTAQPFSPGVVPSDALVAPSGPLLSDASALMATIQPWIGVRYVFGGNSRTGVDCSAFTSAVFRVLGVNLPRTAQGQYNATARVSQPEVGDLVFFQKTYESPDRVTHVGIVVAPGVMISAITPGVGRQSLDGNYWRTHFVGYGRVR